MLRIGFDKMRFLKSLLENTLHWYLRNKLELVLTLDAQYGAIMLPTKPSKMQMNRRSTLGSLERMCHLLRTKLEGKYTDNVAQFKTTGQKKLR